MVTSIGVTHDLAAFVSGTRYAEIPIAVVRQAKLAIADAIGTALAGLDQESVRLIREVAVAEGREGKATVLGCDRSLTASAAALANGAAAHALDYDSISLTVSGFIASPVLFALLAVAEEMGAVSGKQLLEAFVVAWEVEAGIARGLGVHHYAKGWHSTSTLGHFGAAVAVSKLLGFDVQQVRYAIGVAAAEASGLRTMIGNMVNPYHVGKAARNGVVAARLVQRGFVAHQSVLEAAWGFCNVFDGAGTYDLTSITSKLGRPYDLIDPGLVVKMYPCCGLIHSALDGVLDLMPESGFGADDVRHTRIAVHELVPKTMCFERPATGYQAKFSTPFCIATALCEGNVKLAHFTDERTQDPAMKRLMDRVEMVVHPDLHGFDTFLEKEFTDVTIDLVDGRQLNRRVLRIDNRGSRGRPATLDDLAAKFDDCAAGYHNIAGARKAFRLLADLEAVADVREVTACLR